MKPLTTFKIYGAIIALGVITLAARAQNGCIDQITYGPWSCDLDGGVASKGTLTGTNFSICAGSMLTPPGLATNPSFNNGQEVAEEYHSCYPTENGPTYATVTYTAGSLYFVPTNSGWPSMTGPFNTPGTYVYWALVKGNPSFSGCDVITDQVATVYVVVSSSLPVIITQPTNLTVNLGDDATFVVRATGCPGTNYQWWFNVTNRIVGATNSTLLLGDVQMTNAGYYSVVVSDYSGSVTSSLALLTVNVASCLTPPSGIIGWWPGEGNANDIIGTNNGILDNGVTFTNGIVGQAFHFNGTNQDVRIPYSSSLEPTNVTVECWVKLDALASPVAAYPGLQYIVFKQNSRSSDFEGYDLEKNRISGQDVFRFQVTSAAGVQVPAASTTIPQPGVWYHLAGTYDGTNVKIYVNGVLQGSALAGFPLNYGTEPVYFGTTGQSFDGRLEGALDEVSIYNRALSSNEIAAIYQAGNSGKCASTNTFYAIGPTNLITCPEEPATFSVAAGGCSPITYQWEFGTNILNGRTNSTLVLTNAYSGDAGTYSVIVSSSCGRVTNSATLTVLTSLAVAGPEDLSVCAGSAAVFGVTAFGSGPISYQWSFGTNILAHQTNSTLTISNVGPANVGTYSIMVSGACGTVIHSAVLSTLSIATPPGNQTITYGQSATFNVSAAGCDSPAYQWQENGVNIPGANASSYTVVQPTVAESGNQYDVIVSSPYCSLTSSSATLVVNPAPLLVSADNKDRPYGTTNPPLTWTATGFVNGDNSGVLTGNPTLSCAAATNSPVGNYPITISQGALSAANYLLSFSNGTLTVTTAVLDITADNKSRQYGTTNPPLTWTPTGFLNGDTSSVLSGNPTLSCTAATNSTVGNYPIIISTGTLTCTNYSFLFSNGILAVIQAPLTVTASNVTKVTGSPNPTLTGTLVGVTNNDNITATYSTTATTTSLAGNYPIMPALNDPNGKLPNYIVTTNDGTLSITDAPAVILTGPPATITINAGGTMSLGVIAGGTLPLSYQWYFNTTTAIPGATGSNYTKVGIQPSDAGSYSVVVANSRGSVSSSSCILTVHIPPLITLQPTNQIVPQGTTATFIVQASGTPSPTYQWQSNGISITGATSASYTTTNAATYSVIIANSAGSVASQPATLTVVGVNGIIVNGSNPVIEGASTNVLGTVNLLALSNPSGASYPAGYPIWLTIPPIGSPITNTGTSQITVTNSVAGRYTNTVVCGTTNTFILLSVDPNADSDYDGVDDWQEILDGTDPNNPNSVLPRPLGSWLFDDTNHWYGLQGQVPLVFSNIVGVAGVNSNGVRIDSANPALLVYRESETGAGVANMNCRQGTVTFWFSPDWSSGANGGPKTGEARLFEFGAKGTTNGCWGLYLNTQGTNIYFCTQTNTGTSVLKTNLITQINWTSNYWHFIALTYNSTNCSLYLDGVLSTNGSGVTNWPSLPVRTNGFCIGSCRGGTNQACGRFDNFCCHNYCQNSNDIDVTYSEACFSAVDVMLTIDTSGSMGDKTSPTNNNTKIQDAMIAATNFVSHLDFDDDRAGLVTFSNISHLKLTLTNSLTALYSAILNLTNNGSTAIDTGISNSMNVLLANHNSNALPVIVLMTDGSNDPITTYPITNIYKAALAAKNVGIRLVAVALGTNADASDLRNIASPPATNNFYDVTNSGLLLQIYNSISDLLCRTNEAPSVWIDSPTNFQLFNAPSPVPIFASAYDPEGELQQVEFYWGSGTNAHTATNYIGSVYYTNYAGFYYVPWTSPADGTNTLVAVVMSGSGINATSAPVPVIINDLPVISGLNNQLIIWPDDPATVSLTASVTDDGLPNGHLTETWTLQSSNGPVTLQNANMPSATAQFVTNGVYVFNLTASDGAATTGSNCTVTIEQRPFVFITSPTNYELLSSNSAIPINVAAYDYDTYIPTNGAVLWDTANGTTNLLGTATPDGSAGITNLYTFFWTNSIQPGTNTLFAVAKDNFGLTNASPWVTVVVYQPLSVSITPMNSTNCPGSDFEFTTTVSGPGPLTYEWMESTNVLSNQTNSTLTLSNITSSDNGYYSVVVSNLYGSAHASSSLTVYSSLTANGPTNETVIFDGTAVFSTSGSNGVPPYGYQWYSNSVPLAGQSASTLTIANTTISAIYSVVVTGASCGGVTNSATLTVLPPPTIYIVLPPNNAQETAFASLQLMSVVQDQATVTNVVYTNQLNGSFIASSSVSPYLINLANLPAGTYVFQAVAYDSAGRKAISPTVTNVVIKSAPAVQIFEPLSGNTFVVGQNILVGAKATDTGATITNVQFRIGSTVLGNVAAAISNDLYYITWSNAPETYPSSTNITAIAMDNDGSSATSLVSIVVQQPCDAPGVSNLILTASEVLGGNVVMGTVVLSNTAAAGGEAINLASTFPSFASVPPTVYVPQGQWSNSFLINTYPVAVTTNLTISASYHAQSPIASPLMVDSVSVGGTAPVQYCGPMDVVFVIDVTGSMQSELGSIQQSLTTTLNSIVAASGGDYRMGIVTFDGESPSGNCPINCYFPNNDYVTVQQVLMTNDVELITDEIDSLCADNGGWTAEASDEALNTVINALLATNRYQCGDFTTTFRPQARKIVILVTDAPPGGFDDPPDYEYAELAAGYIANAHQYAVEAAQKGIEISTIYEGEGEGQDPYYEQYMGVDVESIMEDYADTTGGIYINDLSAGQQAGQCVQAILAQCGSTAGNVVVVRDDTTTNYTAFTASSAQAGGASAQPALFNLTGTWGSVTAARLLRAGITSASSGSTFDAELGVTTINGQSDSYGLLMTNPNLTGTSPYCFEWALPETFLTPIQSNLDNFCSLQLTDRLSSICGSAYTLTDQPQQAWPLNRNTLTLEVNMDQIIPQGRCRSFVLTGTNGPVNGTWDIVYHGQIIGCSGNPNGWDVEEDHTAFGGFIVTVPSGAAVDMGYQVRVLDQDAVTGQSVLFGVVQSNSIPSAPVLLPLRFSTNMVNSSGGTVSLTVSLDAPAPFGDAYVTLTGPSVASLAPWVVIPTGQSSITTNIQIGSTSPGTLQITASYNGKRVAELTAVNGCESPAAPQIETLVTNDLGVLLAWLPESGADAYDISRSTNGSSFTVIFSGLTTTNFVDTAASPQLTNYYEVIALSNSCESLPAETNLVVPTPLTMPPPSIIPYGGIFNDQATVLITNFIAGSTIYYTTDGTTPTTSSASFGNNINGGTVILTNSANIQALSTANTYAQPSGIASANFTVVHPTPIDCGSNFTSSLSPASSFSAVQGSGYYCSRYIFTNSAAELGQVVTLTASSSDFYPVLYVLDNSTNVLYADFDSIYNGTNSQIVYQITTPGTNIFEVTSYFPWETGDFTLEMDCEAIAGLNVFTNAWLGFNTNYGVFPIGGTLDFGVVALGTSVTNFVTLTNSGTTSLVISNIAVYPNAISNASDGFTIAPSSMITIPAGGITNLVISLFATNISAFDGYFIFNDNDGSLLAQNPFWANLTGEVGANPGVPLVTIYYPTNGLTIPVTNGIITNVVLEIDAGVIDTNSINNFIFTNALFTKATTLGSDGFYTVFWTNPPAGQQVIQAIATDTIGHSGTNSVTINVGIPMLTLTPTNPCVELLNSSFTVIATLLNITNGSVGNSNVVFTVSGADNFTYTNTTDVGGHSSLVYSGTNAGADRITASASVAGVPVQAGPVIMNWAAPLSCGVTNFGTLTNSSGFSMTDQFHYANYYSFGGVAGNIVRLQMTSPDFSTYMFIITNCTVQTNVPVEELNASNTLITYTPPVTGTYIVEATSSDIFKTGNYALMLLCGATPEPEMAAYVSGTNFPNYGLLNFGSVLTNVPVTNTLVITNEGNAPLSLTGWSLYNGLTNVYSLLNPVVTVLAAGSSTNIAIQFMATNSGQYQDALIITNNDQYQNPFVVNLDGIANPNNTPPAVTITSPSSGAQFLAGGSFNIVANAVPGHGASVTNVTFIFNTTQGTYLIGSTTNPVSGTLYSVVWTFPTPGNYGLRAVAYDNDGGISISPQVNISVVPSSLNQPPVTRPDYVTVLSGSMNDVLNVLTNDYSPSGDPLTITAIIPSTTPQPHGTATIVDGGKHIAYTPPPGQGSPDPTLIEDGFSYQISDGKGGTALCAVYVSIFATSLPGICITNPPDGWTTNAGAIVPLVAYVNPYQYVTSVTFYYGDSIIGVVTNGPNSANGYYTNYWTALIKEPPCGCHFTAQAMDMFGQINTSQSIDISVTNPATGGGQQPIASLDSYTGFNDTNTSGTLTPDATSASLIPTGVTIQSGIFNIYGQATNAADGDPVTWTLGLYSTDGSTLIRNLVSNGTTPVGTAGGPGFLATCDLTTIQNGPYQLRLDVISDGYDSESSVQISLDSNLKIGEFRFSQQDLVIPVNGIPLTITRTYNSINPNSADFGYGWTFAINSMNVQLDETRENISHGKGTVSIRSGGGRDVTLTLPDGRTATFNCNLVEGGAAFAEGTAYNAVWSAQGVAATLKTLYSSSGGGDLGDNTLVTLPGLNYYWQDGGQQSTIDNYDMPGWILTTPDQTQYYITRGTAKTVSYQDADGLPLTATVYGTPKLTRIVEHSGDSVQIGDNSITHYDAAGNATASIQFDRDTQGRIIAIHDPTGGANGFPAVKYEYDAAGNLVHVGRLVDRNAGTYVTNSFVYTSSQFPHYITSMLNGDGTQAAQSYYDDSGKLEETIDADGNITYFSSNLSNNTQTVVDRLNNTNLFIYDSRGNVLSQTDPLGHTTTEAYDANNNVIQSVDPLGNTNTFAYDANNNQTMAADSMNHTNLYAYDSACDLTSAINPLGDAMAASYDQNGNLLQSVVQDPNGNVIAQASSTYNNGLLASMQNASGQAFVSFGYDPSSDYMTSVKSADGATGNFAYDACGNETNCSYIWTAPDGSQVTLTNLAFFDAQNRVTMTIDEYGNTNQMFYDLNGHVSYTIDRYGNTNSFLYDARGDLIVASNALGTVTHTVYDSDARPILTSDPNGITGTLMEYDADGRATNMIRLENVQVNLIPDTNAPGLMTTVIASLGSGLSTNSTTYYPNGWTQSQTSPDGTTTYTYWPNGQTETVTDPLNHTTTIAYTASGLQSLVWDANNHGTRFVYDAVGRMVSTIYDNHTSVSNIFNSLGLRAGSVDQNGLLTQFNYNLAGKMTNVIKPQLAAGIPSWFYQYDTNGQLAVTTDPLGHSTTNFYDPFGHQVAQALPMGQTNISAVYTNGLLWKQYDFIGQMIEHHYDNFGRETNKAYFAVGATTGTAASYAVSYAYNQLNQLTNVTQFYGSSASQFVATLNPNGKGFASVPLSARLTASLNRYPDFFGGTTVLFMLGMAMAVIPSEKRRRMVLAFAQAWRASFLRPYRFDAQPGRIRVLSPIWRFVAPITLLAVLLSQPGYYQLCTAQAQCYIPSNFSTSSIRITAFTYDIEGNLSQVNSPEGVINYSYDLATGRMTSLCTANSEQEYGYDALGRLQNVTVVRRNGATLTTPETTTYAYDAVGNRSSVSLPNGVVTTYQYDDLNRLTNLTHTAQGNVLLASYAYQLDLTGRRTNAIEVMQQEGGTYQTNSLTWQFDPMYRSTNEICVCSASSASYTNSYVYDLAGNRTHKASVGQSTDNVGYTFDNNDELLSEISTINGTTSYLYDRNGSLTNKASSTETLNYVYDVASQLSSVTSGWNTTAYRYDPNGIRVESVTGGVPTEYLVDARNHTGFEQVLEELPSLGAAPSRSYVIGDDVLAQADGSGNVSYLLQDGHGSTRQLMGGGSVSSVYNFDAYGQSLGAKFTPVNLPATPVLFAGQQFDVNAQQYYQRARYYDPANGRFNQRDTYAGSRFDPQSIHKYLYCGGDPVNVVDPSGRDGLADLMVSMSISTAIDAFVDLTETMLEVNEVWKTLQQVNDLINPAREVNASEVPEFDKECAHLCSDVYNGQHIGWESWKPTNLGLDQNLFSSGSFVSQLYDEGNNNDYALAFRGTMTTGLSDIIGDWYSNIMQSLYGPLVYTQYDEAADVADQVSYKLGNSKNLTMTGHSLGGGLAAVAALSTDRPAVTFNAAGVNGLTFIANGGLSYNNRIKNYSVEGEILTTLQRNMPLMPEALGQQYFLPVIKADQSKSPIGLHGMDTVLDSLGEGPNTPKPGS